MSELSIAQIMLLKHIHGGGLVAVATYGKRDVTTEVTTYPKFHAGAGLRSISDLQERGLVRYGDASPYKSGKSLPLVLTDAGKEAVV